MCVCRTSSTYFSGMRNGLFLRHIQVLSSLNVMSKDKASRNTPRNHSSLPSHLVVQGQICRPLLLDEHCSSTNTLPWPLVVQLHSAHDVRKTVSQTSPRFASPCGHARTPAPCASNPCHVRSSFQILHRPYKAYCVRPVQCLSISESCTLLTSVL